MIIELTVQRVYKYEIDVAAVAGPDGTIAFTAKLAQEGFLSHFDNFMDYSGPTMEAALEKIAKAIDASLKAMQEF